MYLQATLNTCSSSIVFRSPMKLLHLPRLEMQLRDHRRLVFRRTWPRTWSAFERDEQAPREIARDLSLGTLIIVTFLQTDQLRLASRETLRTTCREYVPDVPARKQERTVARIHTVMASPGRTQLAVFHRTWLKTCVEYVQDVAESPANEPPKSKGSAAVPKAQ